MASSTDTVAAFEALVSRAKEYAHNEDMTSAILAEINEGIAKVVELLGKPEKSDTQEEAQAMGKAFAAALASLKMPAPEVSVSPQITLQAPPEREHPAPNIIVNPVIASPAGTQFTIELTERDMAGRAKKYLITKL